MADADIIAQVYPFKDTLSLARGAIETNSRYMPPSRVQQEHRITQSRTSREPTEPPNDKNDPAILPYLDIRFSHAPRTTSGLVFGTDATRCDIILPKLPGVSKRHFALTYKHNFADGCPRLIVRDLGSTCGTTVLYDGKGADKTRSDFDWILDGFFTTDNIKTLIVQLHDNLQFRIIVARHDIRSPTYTNNVTRFLQGAADPSDLLHGLGVQSGPVTKRNTGTHTPVRKPILLALGWIGKGGFGVVSRHWNVSTGEELACKRPLDGRDYDRRAWEKEINIMKGTWHDHIVRLCFSRISPSPPLLYMEYMAFGNLQSAHDKMPFSYEECVSILVQGASALTYLHERSDPITHRDLKPENILVQHRDPKGDPDSLCIKLSDFGLAKIGNSLKTGCHSETYCPPEIYPGSRERYTKAVDIWSLGVVVLRFAYNLPHPGHGIGIGWCQKVIDQAQSCGLEGLINILRRMLVIDAKVRCSAVDCWNEAARLQLSSQGRSTKATPASYDAGLPYKIANAQSSGYDYPSPSLESHLEDDSQISENPAFIRSNGPPPPSAKMLSHRKMPSDRSVVGTTQHPCLGIDIAQWEGQPAYTDTEKDVAAALLGMIEMAPAQPGHTGWGQPESSAPQPDPRSIHGPSPSYYADGRPRVFARLSDDPSSPSGHGPSVFQRAAGQPQASVPAPDPVPAPMPGPETSYVKLTYAGATIMYRANDGLVNITQLLKAVGYTKTVRWASVEKKLGPLGKAVRHGRYTGGTYVSLATAQTILRNFQLSDTSLPVLTRQIEDIR